MSHISSYPSIYAVGHRSIKDIFSSEVVIEEKVDGSQFSMERLNGELSCRSKGQQIILDAPNKMFEAAVATAQSLDLHDGWTYRCEYLAKPKHNTLAYARIPKQHLILFDVMTAPETYLTPAEKRAEADRLGLECVPCFIHAIHPQLTAGLAEKLLQNDSILGGCKIEGFVVKNYNLITLEKKIAIAKFVSAAFQEKHRHEWKAANPSSGDFITTFIASLKTEARWSKAVQHLRDAGNLTESPQDIGNLLKEVQADLLKEESDFIKDRLFNHFITQIKRGVISGFPEWYKTQIGLNLDTQQPQPSSPEASEAPAASAGGMQAASGVAGHATMP